MAESIAVDLDALEEALPRSWERRAPLHASSDTNAYRVHHGHEDGERSVDVDLYADLAVATVKSAEFPREGSIRLAARLLDFDPIERVAVRVKRRHSADPTPLRIDVVPENAERVGIAVESGLEFEIDAGREDHPGLFLDARPLRTRLREIASGASVLNLFAFTGSLGVAAIAGGATECVHVDKRREPLDIARRNHERNAQRVDGRNFVAGDIFKHLPRAKRSGREFDIVVIDPPPEFRTTRKRSSRPSRRDFRKTIELAAPLVSRGGRLVVLVHRHDRALEEYESDCISAAGGDFRVDERGRTGEDFSEGGSTTAKWIELSRH